METKNYIDLNQLCSIYKVEISFFESLKEIGLIDITIIENTLFIHQDRINDIEKMIRMHHELDVNIEGIDIVFNLLQKIDSLQNELNAVKNRLTIYEKE